MNREGTPIFGSLRHRVGKDARRRSTRRKLLLGAAGWPVLAWAEIVYAQKPTKVWRVGFLTSGSGPVSLDPANPSSFNAFIQGMRELGYVEGQNLLIERRFAESKIERLPGMAEELVRLKVDVIVTGGTPATRAAQQATRTIPIVFGSAGDPVGSGLVKSLPRPGGNITGRSLISSDVDPKLLDILLSVAPKLPRVAYLMNPGNLSSIATLKHLQAAAQKRGIRILPFEVKTSAQIDDVFAMMSGQNAEAVIVSLDSLFNQQRRRIVDLAAKHRLLSIAATSTFAEAGGLIGYGQIIADNYRHVASYVDRIFKGAKPAELPVEQPTTFEFVVNLKTAKALGITIPEKLLLRADRVIE